MQKERTPTEKAHRFCTLIVRTGDDAFDLLISVLNTVKQRHVADELLMIEREGYVHTSNTEGKRKWVHCIASFAKTKIEA